MREFGMKPGTAKPASVDDILASVEDAVRRAYALGRSDAMKRVVELAQSDDPGLRAVALLGPAEPARRESSPVFLEAPIEPAPVMEQAPPDGAPVAHAELHERSEAGLPPSPQPASQQSAPPQPALQEPGSQEPAADRPAQASAQEPPRSVGNFLADYFYPLGSKK